MTEAGGLPTGIPGLQGDLDAATRRYESLLRDRIEPRIVGVRMRAVPLTNGLRALVISVPRSWNPPHAVVHHDARLIFARNSAGAHHASVDEMRSMFITGATLLERAREFQRQRMEEIHSGDGPGPLPFSGEGGRIVLHIIPFSAVSSESSLINLRLVFGKNLNPIYHGQQNTWGYNAEGYYTTSRPIRPAGYVQVFRDGIIKSAAGDVRTPVDGHHLLSARTLENEVAAKVFDYMSMLSEAGVTPPVFIMLGGVRMHGTNVTGDGTATGPPLRGAEIYFPPIILEEYGDRETYRNALRPIFDANSNAAGTEGSPTLGR